MFAAEVEDVLKKMNLPPRDLYTIPTSHKTFPDGAHYRTEELPSTVDDYERLFALAKKRGYVVNRVTDVRGVMFDSDAELQEKCALAQAHGSELFLAPGSGENPFDISQQAEIHQIVEGKLRGMDNVRYTLESLLRASELGCRGFLMYDEGVLSVALKMRQEGKLPAETKFKLSANVSLANAAAVRFWFDVLGPRDEINVARDLTLPMIAAIRQVSDHPLDIHVFHRLSVARTMEAPEIVRVGSPVYLKNARFGPGLDVEDRALQCFRLIEALRSNLPAARQSCPGASDLAIPVIPPVGVGGANTFQHVGSQNQGGSHASGN